MSLNLTFVGMRSPTAWALDLVCKAIGRTVGSSPSLESVLQRVSSPTRRRRWRASRSTQEASCGGPPGLLGNLEVTRKKLSSSEGAGGHRCGEGGGPATQRVRAVMHRCGFNSETQHGAMAAGIRCAATKVCPLPTRHGGAFS